MQKQLKDEGFAICLLQMCFIDTYYPETFYSVMAKVIEVQGIPTIERKDVYERKLKDFKAKRMDWLELEALRQDNDRDHNELIEWDN